MKRKLVSIAGGLICAAVLLLSNTLFSGLAVASVVVKDFAVSPDGKSVAVAVTDNTTIDTISTVFVLLLEDGHVLAQFPADMPHNVAFSPDGKLLVVGQIASNEPGLVWFDVASQQKVPALAEDGDVRGLAFSPDGHYLATSTPRGVSITELPHDNLVFDKDVEPGDPQTGHQFGYFDLAFTPDNKLLFAQDGDQYLRWDWRANKEFYHYTPVYSSALRPDGKIIAYCLHERIELHSALNDKLLQIIPFPSKDTLWDLTYSPGGKILAINNSKIWLYNLEKKTQTMVYDGTLGGPGHPRFTTDGKRLVGALHVSRTEYDIGVWDLATRKLIHRFPIPAPVVNKESAVFTPHPSPAADRKPQ